MSKQSDKKISLVLLIMFVVKSSGLIAQVSIAGPECVIPGLTYQYIIHGSWNENSTMRVCVTGGSLNTGEACTPGSSLVSSVFVVWRDTSLHKLELTSSAGNAVLEVQGTTALRGGLIHDSDRVKVYDSTISSYTFRCEGAGGGTCTPVYLYQWQKSVNGLNWDNIEGATGKDYVFTGTVQVNTYFRRVTTETSSQTLAYSDSGLLVVVFNE